MRKNTKFRMLLLVTLLLTAFAADKPPITYADDCGPYPQGNYEVPGWCDRLYNWCLCDTAGQSGGPCGTSYMLSNGCPGY